MPHWLKHTHPEYDRRFERYIFAFDHLRANVHEIDTEEVSHPEPANLHRIQSQSFNTEIIARSNTVEREYLIQRAQGEGDEKYEERKKISAYTPYFQYAVISLAGMLFQVEPEATRQWSSEEEEDGLGTADEDDTIAARMEADYNGEGVSRAMWYRKLAVDLIGMKDMWGVVEGVRRESGQKIGEAAAKMLNPLLVENWLADEDGRLTEAKVRLSHDQRTSMEDDPDLAEEEQRVHYHLDGWERYRENEDGEFELVEEGEYEFYATADRNRRILPIFRISLPLRGMPGYTAARQVNSIFNLESGLDFSLWMSSFAKLMVDATDEDGHFDGELYEELQEALEEGRAALPGLHEFRAPPAQAGQLKMERIQEKVKGFFKTFYQMFGDAARERTATQIRQEARSGVEAFLELLSTTLDEAETHAGFLLEQVYFPDRPELWGQYEVSRSTDFQPVDMDARIDQLIQQTMPTGRVPITPEMGAQIIRQWADQKGIAIDEDEDELVSQVEQALSRETRAQSTLGDLGL